MDNQMIHHLTTHTDIDSWVALLAARGTFTRFEAGRLYGGVVVAGESRDD
jgi:hypothetical protein